MKVPFGVPLATKETVPLQESEQLLATVRAAAEALVADLERARQATGDWSEPSLTEALTEAALAACLFRLAATNVWGEANRMPSNELWRVAGPWLELGAMQWHARFKPRGYAGDYQMLERIAANYRAEHPLGRACDRYFQTQAAPEAVRARIQHVAVALASHCLQSPSRQPHIVSIGAGPGLDVAQGVAMLPETHRSRLRVTLLDLDPEALEFARRQVEPWLAPGGLNCLRENLYRLPQKPQAQGHLADADLIICSGLFDYLEDEAAVAMLGLFWRQLVPGGLLLVGNFAPHNPTRAYMEWIGNWYLLYRQPEQLERLALDAGIPPAQFTIGSERLGVNLFLIGHKS